MKNEQITNNTKTNGSQGTNNKENRTNETTRKNNTQNKTTWKQKKEQITCNAKAMKTRTNSKHNKLNRKQTNN